MATTATTRLLDALRASQGNCTDYRAGKLLGMTTATVSRWRTGKSHMSMANIARACELAGFPERTWEWQIRIGAERELGPDGDVYREALADLERVRAGQDPSSSGLFAMLRHISRAAVILIAVAISAGPLAAEKSAFARAQGGAGSAPSTVYSVKSLMRRLRWLLWVPIAALASGCAALQTPEERVWQALHAADAAMTLNIVGDPCYAEGHPITRELIGREPTREAVIAWAIGGAALHAGVSDWLLRTGRERAFRWWQYVTILDTAYAVGKGWSIGVRFFGDNQPRRCLK